MIRQLYKQHAERCNVGLFRHLKSVCTANLVESDQSLGSPQLVPRHLLRVGRQHVNELYLGGKLKQG